VWVTPAGDHRKEKMNHFSLTDRAELHGRLSDDEQSWISVGSQRVEDRRDVGLGSHTPPIA
jgi:hypothetical protein